jgi:lipopolysaccharide export system protein LptA
MLSAARTQRAFVAAIVATAGSIACLGAPIAARAQLDTHSKAPMDITADEAELVQSKCQAIWRGSAEGVQGDSRLRADTITVFARPKGVGDNGQPACGGTDRVLAEGHVYYVTPQQHVRGDKAVYNAADDEIVITGDVIAVQGDDVARGDRMTIKVSTKEIKMESTITGAGKSGRVRGVFYPAQNGQAPGQPSVKP